MFSVYARVYDAGAAALRSAEQNSGPELAASACEYYIVQKRRKAGALHSKSKFALPPREKNRPLFPVGAHDIKPATFKARV
jgi:hypothetical protein